MAITVVRPVVVDDDGSGDGGGTVLNAAFFNRLLDYVDAKVEEAKQAATDAQASAEMAARTAENVRAMKL